MKHVVALSGGKDSTCLALALREREPRAYLYVCTPTGDELPAMLAHWSALEERLGQPVIRLANGTLNRVIYDNMMLPNTHARFCTRILKLRPFAEFMKMQAPAVAYVGLRADEDDREGTRPGGDGVALSVKVTYDFPLRRWGWGLDDVQAYLLSRKIVIPERTDCARCPYQRLGEWYNLWHDHPAIYADAEGDELVFGHTFRSDQRDSWPAGLTELRHLFEAGHVPARSLRMMEKRRNMCRACSL